MNRKTPVETCGCVRNLRGLRAETVCSHHSSPQTIAIPVDHSTFHMYCMHKRSCSSRSELCLEHQRTHACARSLTLASITHACPCARTHARTGDKEHEMSCGTKSTCNERRHTMPPSFGGEHLPEEPPNAPILTVLQEGRSSSSPKCRLCLTGLMTPRLQNTVDTFKS